MLSAGRSPEAKVSTIMQASFRVPDLAELRHAICAQTLTNPATRVVGAIASRLAARPDFVTPDAPRGPAAEGYARASGIPFGQGLVKNRYIGRTFIMPGQALRKKSVRQKLNPIGME